MVRIIHQTVDDSLHEEISVVKGKRTWIEFFKDIVAQGKKDD